MKQQQQPRLNPEYVDCEGLYQIFGIKRSLAYQLMGAGVLESVSVISPAFPHATRGKRLFKVASVRKYLESCGGSNASGN